MHPARIVFLGTGTSERVPRVTCLTKQPPICAVCIDSQRPGSRNFRRNTSLLIQTADPDGKPVNIVIDAGKSFYEACMEWFPKFGVASLDAVVITHAHADAIAGLDDLRDWTNYSRGTLPVYVRGVDMPTLSKTHFYLVDRAQSTSGGGVARLQFVETDTEPFDVLGVRFTPLPVEHGPGVTSHGYRVGDVCYIPDVSAIPPSTEKRLDGCGVLVLDALRPGRTHGSHLSLEQSVDTARRLRPGRTLLTDMAHDINHEPVNAELARLKESEGLDIQLAYDGLSFETEV
ncbi:MAG: MBL fold metallo-hydrolase [Chloroflexi bacterium]|nr:MBL fold metallo-hydrolase [Chloroflexota bacterium]